MALFKDDKESENRQQVAETRRYSMTWQVTVLMVLLKTQSARTSGWFSPAPAPTMHGHQPGSWRNSSTEEKLRSYCRPLAFKTAWIERSKEPPYETVGRYEPNSIPVKVEMPSPDRIPKRRPETGTRASSMLMKETHRSHTSARMPEAVECAGPRGSLGHRYAFLAPHDLVRTLRRESVCQSQEELLKNS